MIKIQIADVAAKEQEYVDAIRDVVLNRVNILIRALRDLNGDGFDFESVSFASLKPTTRDIIYLVNANLDLNLNVRNNYQNVVTNYINNANNLQQINIAGLLGLLNHLVINDGYNLNALLCCKPGELLNRNNFLLNNFDVNTGIDKNVIKLAFDYERYNTDIGSKIKLYFRDNGFSKFCPYCNREEVEFKVNQYGNVVQSHQLDHFFDKATHPLLCYSMYNLVPSDSTCNATNKDEIQFTDEFFLNPYTEGFGNSIHFSPNKISTGYEVADICIEINEPANSPRRRQLIGDNNSINENDDHGNINVFKLESKYNSDEMRRHAKKILIDINANYKGLRSLKKFTDLLMPVNILRNDYLKWYDDNIKTSFHSNEFNNFRFSKFNRDIHDYYFNLNKTKGSRFIRTLIAENLN